MSEQINKVLASTAQAFSTAEQKQARDNIGAQASGNYVSASAMSAYVPFSAISADANSAITSINGSSVGTPFTGVSAGNCISGDGTSGSPLGLSATAQWTAGANWYPMTEISAGYLKISAGAFAGAQIYQSESSFCNWNPTGITVRHTASGVGGGNIDNFYGEILNLNYNAGQYYLHHISSDASGLRAKQNGNPNNASIFGFGSAAFSDDNETTWEVVDPSSIRRWNSQSASGWAESGNSLSTGFGGNQATAASQYNEGASNWAARTVKMSGLPDQTLYGFQSRPNGTATFGINQAGAFVAIPQSKYFTYLFHETGAAMHTFDIEIYPTGLTADARLDFVNLCSAASANVKTDTFHGNTANINPGESATMWYIATADIWTDGFNPVPV
jgi:hypothetical protein